MINVIKVNALGIEHTRSNDDNGDLIAYYDPVASTWQCVRNAAPVRAKLRNGDHHYKSYIEWHEGCVIKVRRPNKDVTPLAPGEIVLAYQDNESRWHTWPHVTS
jgi:hypothetical protein